MENLDSLIQGKLDADTEFHASIADLSDDEKNSKIAEKRSEILNTEWKSLAEKAQEAEKAKELAKNYKIRAEKAEKGKKGDGDAPNTVTDGENLSMKDMFALTEAKVHVDDIDDVVRASKLFGKSIPETLKDVVFQGVLAKKAEQRKSAEAIATKTQRPSNYKASDAELLKNLSKGEVPEPGSEDAERLFWAKNGGKPSK